jgi:hypothetical protein
MWKYRNSASNLAHETETLCIESRMATPKRNNAVSRLVCLLTKHNICPFCERTDTQYYSSTLTSWSRLAKIKQGAGSRPVLYRALAESTIMQIKSLSRANGMVELAESSDLIRN